MIFDEVFTGCWRLGAPSAAALLGAAPDIACYAKLLTGGLLPLAATLATEAVFDAFKGGRDELLCSASLCIAQPCSASTCTALPALLSLAQRCSALLSLARMRNCSLPRSFEAKGALHW